MDGKRILCSTLIWDDQLLPQVIGKYGVDGNAWEHWLWKSSDLVLMG